MNGILDILACPTCAQAFEHTTGNAAGYAILFMLCIVFPMLTTIGVCIFRIARRQKKAVDAENDPYADPFLSEN